MPIETPADLRDHLELAIGVELSTIPPYLYAAYSIVDQQSEPALLIKSIVVEEMLHATLAANLLLAVGGDPSFARAAAIPQYPMALPHHVPELTLNLEPCSPRLIHDTLMVVEQPEAPGAAAEADRYETLGQFYAALESAVMALAASGNLFANPQRSRQLADPSFYRPVVFDAEDSGGLTLIDDAESALAAIEIIVHQGEGLADHRWADPAHQELTHYYKLKQIHDGAAPLGAVRPALTNPRPGDMPHSLGPVLDLFDAVYRMVYLVLDRLFRPVDDKAPLVKRLYRLMSEGLGPLAVYLMCQPVRPDKVAGPCFGIFEFAIEPDEELKRLGSAVLPGHPELASVIDAIQSI